MARVYSILTSGQEFDAWANGNILKDNIDPEGPVWKQDQLWMIESKLINLPFESKLINLSFESQYQADIHKRYRLI